MKNLFLKIIFSLLIWVSTEAYVNPVFALDPPGKKVEALLRQGDKHFKERFFYQAIQFYQEALNLVPDHAHAHFQLAECYRNLFEYQSAKPHYKVVYQASQEDFPSSGYYLALMSKFSGEYAISVKYFDEFITFAEQKKFPHKDQLVQQAHLEKEGALLALQNTLKPKGQFDFARLPAPVNSAYNDYAATIFHDNSTIAVTSTRSDTKGRNINDQYGGFYSDHFLFTKNENDEWEDRSKESDFAGINTHFSEGTGVFNKEKNIFYFTGCYQEGYCHLYKSEFKNGKWQSPRSLGDQVNLKGYDSKQPGLTTGGDTLFFVSNRQGGYGMQDIWMSTLSADGTWQSPVNLGPGINTAQNELSPFYYPLNKTLFFSSNGHKGYGGYDIFVTPVPSDSISLSVVNLGQPFNSSKDDLYLCLGDQKGYLSSNRGDTVGKFDIYTFNVIAREAVLLSMQNDANPTAFSGSMSILQFFSIQDRLYFQQLPLEEKAKVQRFIEQNSFRKALSEKAILNESLSFFYESLAAEEKSILERLSVAQKHFLLNESQEALLPADLFYYENLPLDKKEKIQQIIERHALGKILEDEMPADPQLSLFYENLPLKDKERINRAVAARHEFIEKSFQVSPLSTFDDFFFYQTLPLEEREKVKRMVAARTFQKEQANHSELQEEILQTYEQLPLEEKQRIDRMTNARRFTTKAIEDAASPDRHFEKDYFNIGLLAISNPENITIEGKILADNKPAGAVNVSLVNESNQKEKSTTTNQEGAFSFSYVSYHKDQKILFDQEVDFMQLTRFTLEELRVIVLQDTIIQETFDNIYFETDQYTINDSSKVILDKLADFHFKYPDVQIEISGYADTTGGNPYNQQLSFKRAAEAFKYLTSKGVDQTAIYVLPKGKEVPQKGKGLQYSRRIEFSLHAISASYNPTREIFVISPKPDLKEIAGRYKLSLSELMEMNQQIEGEPAPYTPIRVLSRRK
jgi:outer membrane protein OmpA-like peptidoglycan-associated protein